MHPDKHFLNRASYAITDQDASDRYHHAQKFRVLNSFAIALMSIPNVDDLFWYVAQNVVGQLGFIDCVIYQANDEQTELIQVAALGDKNPFGRAIVNPLKIPFGKGITGRVAQSHETIMVGDLKNDIDYIADTQPARSELCVPILSKNRVLGVIDSENTEPNAFGDDELEILTTVAAMTSAKLELLEEKELSNRIQKKLTSTLHDLTQESSTRAALESELAEERKHNAMIKFVGSFAHRINNRLAAIIGNLEIAETLGNSADISQDIALAREEAWRAANVTKNMMRYAQCDMLKNEEFNLNSLVKSLKPLPGDEEKSVKITYDLSPNAWKAFADVTVTKNVINAVLQNAFETVAPHSGMIHLETSNVNMTPDKLKSCRLKIPAGRYICVSIRDNGPGILPKVAQRIFDPFYTTKDSEEDAGCGLAAVSGFMKQSNGTIRVESDIGRGSTFNLYFPVSPKNR